MGTRWDEREKHGEDGGRRGGVCWRERDSSASGWRERLRAGNGALQAPFLGRDPLWVYEEYEVELAFPDGSRFVGRALGLHLRHGGVLTDTHGRRYRVTLSGDPLIPDANLQSVARREVHPPISASESALFLRVAQEGGLTAPRYRRFAACRGSGQPAGFLPILRGGGRRG